VENINPKPNPNKSSRKRRGMRNQINFGKNPSVIFTATIKIPIPIISLMIELIPIETSNTFDGKDKFLIKRALSRITVVDLWTIS
jgi:hypothetical protein